LPDLNLLDFVCSRIVAAVVVVAVVVLFPLEPGVLLLWASLLALLVVESCIVLFGFDWSWLIGCVLVHFNSVLCEKYLVGLFCCQPCLVLVRDELPEIFQGCGPEHLCQKKFGMCFDRSVGILSEGIFRVPSLQLLCWSVWFNPVCCEVFIQNVEKFLQSCEKHSGIFVVPVGEFGQSIDDQFVVRDGGKFLFEKRSDPGPGFLSQSEFQVASF
jgi:hypothetical protein